MFEDDIVIVEYNIKTRLERRSTTAPAPNKSQRLGTHTPHTASRLFLHIYVDWLYITDYRLRKT